MNNQKVTTMANYIWVVTKHEGIIEGKVSSRSYYFCAESEDKAKAKYEKLCAEFTKEGYTCDFDDHFGTIDDVAGLELLSSFRDFVKVTKGGKKRAEVEIGAEEIK